MRACLFLVSGGEVLWAAGGADPAEGAESQGEDVAHDVLDIARVPAKSTVGIYVI